MLKLTESRLKFFLKMRATHSLRSFLLFLFGVTVNRDGWEQRMLIVNLEAIGDLAMFTSVLKHYRASFSGKKLYLLIKSGTGMENMFRRHFVDEVITVRYKAFSAYPWYGFSLINRLRRIGFAKVINHDFSAAEAIGKIISVSVGARDVIGYEGQAVEFLKPFDVQQAKTLLMVRKKIFPRYTALLPTVAIDPATTGYFPHEISYYRLLYEYASGTKGQDYIPELFYDDTAGPAMLAKLGVTKGRYVVMNINSGARCKCWPPERFSQIATYIHSLGFVIVLVGSPSEAAFVRGFQNSCPVRMVDASGKTDFDELVALVANSFLVFSNDTSTIHIAVALKKPSFCIVGGGQFGVAIDYGYADINRWVYKKTDCFFDNWHCCRDAAPGMPSACVAAVGVADVLHEFKPFAERIQKTKRLPQEPFAERFPGLPKGILASRAPARKLKVVYSGIQAENYNPARRPSFEHQNFYETLKHMPDVEVIEYPYDLILRIGKEKFNADLLRLITKERPDLFFAFMFTDEFAPAILDEIKTLTKSVAWFADDTWRVPNYSRHWAPHFTAAVTTTPFAPLSYAQYGVENVLVSQWAHNPFLWKPTPATKNIAVSLIGQRTHRRENLIERLRAAGIAVVVRGWGWPEGRVSHEDMIRIIASSKITLNLNDPPSIFSPKAFGRLILRHSIDRFVPSFHFLDNFAAWRQFGLPQIKARPFELAGMGGFVISGAADGMERYYRENEEMVFYRDTDDLIQKITYYLKHDAERERIAEAARRRTLSEHTYVARFRKLFSELGLQ